MLDFPDIRAIKRRKYELKISEVIDYYIISDADANKPRLKLYLLEHTLLLRVLSFYIFTVLKCKCLWQHFQTNIFIRNYINCTMVLKRMMISK